MMQKEKKMIIRYSNISILVIAMAVCADAQSPLIKEIKLPDEIRNALIQNAENMSPISIASTQQYCFLLTPEETLEKLKIPAGYGDSFYVKENRQIKWQTGKTYATKREVNQDNDSYLLERSFDGQVYYSGSQYSKKQCLLKQLPAKLAKTNLDNEHLIRTDYFDAAGLRLPIRARDMQANKNSVSEILFLLETGGHLSLLKETEFDGQRMTLVEVIADNQDRRRAEGKDIAELEEFLRSGKNTEEYIQHELAVNRQMRDLPENKVYRFYLDPQKKYAIVRREERYEDGRLLLQVNNKDFVKLSGRELWLPRKSTVNYYKRPGSDYFEKPILSREIEVTELNLDAIPDTQFTLDYRMPGTIITDDTLPGKAISFIIPAEAELLDALIEEVLPDSGIEKEPRVSASVTESDLEGSQFRAERPEPIITIPNPALSRRGTNWTLVFLLNAVALFTLIALAVWRYKSSSA